MMLIATILEKLTAALFEYNLNKKIEIDKMLFPHKVAVYQEFVDLVTDFSSNPNKTKKDMERIGKKLIKIRRNMIFWASPETLIAFNELMSLDENSNNRNRDVAQASDKFYRCIRKDLGHLDGSQVNNGMLFKMFLTPESRKEVEESGYFDKN